MKVTTHTERLLRVRKNVLELLLAYGDHNCLMCETNGECELQNLVYEHGIDAVRFKTDFVSNPVDDSNSMIVRDPNKCVLCGRCVRGCLSVQVNGVIDMAGRGADLHFQRRSSQRFELRLLRRVRRSLSNRGAD